MSGCFVHCQCRVAKRELLSIKSDYIALGLWPWLGIAAHPVPIFLSENDPGTKMILEILCSTSVIDMTMANNHILDGSRIKAEFLQSTDNLILYRIVPYSIDNDDAFGGSHCPSRVLRLSDKVKIVKDFYRFSIPIRTIWSLTRWSRRCGWLTDGIEQSDMLLPSGFSRCRNVSINRVGRLSSRGD